VVYSGAVYDLGPYLDQFELHAGKREMGHLPGKSQATQEIAQVVGQDEKGKTHLVGYESGAG
jgi:hypothetical protein